MTKKILYIEDEVELSKLALQAFERKAFNCIHSTTLVDAVKKSQNQKFDIIITDIKLEKGTGDQLIKSIKTNPSHINFQTPIIVSSAFLTKEVIEEIKGKINKVMVKPHLIDDLIDAVAQVMN